MRVSMAGRMVCTVLAALMVAGGVRADEEKVPLDKVPAKVRQALKTKYPRAEVVSAEKEDENGKTVYEFKLKQGKKKWEASFTPDGDFVGIEEVIKESDLPAQVKEGLRKKYPHAKVLRVEKETTGEGDSAKVVYEIVVQDKKGKREVQFDPHGKFRGEEK